MLFLLFLLFWLFLLFFLLVTLSALSPQSGFTSNEVRRGLVPGDSRPGPGGLCSMHPPPSHSDLDADANYTALTPRPRLSPSFRCSPDCFGGSIAVCPVAARRLARIALAYRSMCTWWLPDGSLLSLRRIVRRVPVSCTTFYLIARSTVWFGGVPGCQLTRWLVRRLPDVLPGILPGSSLDGPVRWLG